MGFVAPQLRCRTAQPGATLPKAKPPRKPPVKPCVSLPGILAQRMALQAVPGRPTCCTSRKLSSSKGMPRVIFHLDMDAIFKL
jgi:hypothetical protein